MGSLIESLVVSKEGRVEQCLFQTPNLLTPAFVYDEDSILKKINTLSKLKRESDCKILFPLKTFSFFHALKIIANEVDGFSTSSLFETKLAREILGTRGLVHFTSPGLRPDEYKPIAEGCDYISFNSLSQWNQFSKKNRVKVSCGLRINPQLSFVKDERYNPCRKFSKLGVPLTQLLETDSESLRRIDGILIHNNSESRDFKQLVKTITHVTSQLPSLFKNLKWINIGGGYLFDETVNLDCLVETILTLNRQYDQVVLFEPGKGIVGDAGYIVSRVLDIFKNDGRDIAVLDTSVNHMPEVFEYQFEPTVLNCSKNGKWQYLLAGSTCLAGDLFGEFCFDEQLEIGSRIIFKTMGAYTLVKAHMFNGINLPSVYAYSKERELVLKKKFNYDDFFVKCGGGEYVAL